MIYIYNNYYANNTPIGCIDEKGCVYQGQYANKTPIAVIDEKGRLHRGQYKNGTMIGCVDGKGKVYAGQYANTIPIGCVDPHGRIIRGQYVSGPPIAASKGHNPYWGALAYLLLFDQPPQASAGGCYIATAVYQDYNAPEVVVLRNFRDATLLKTFWGRLFVKVYYHFSPPIADWLKDADALNRYVKKWLDKFVSLLLAKDLK